MPAMAEVELTRGPDDPHPVPTVLTAMHLGDDDLCSICWKDDASAYWDGGPETFRVCRRCAVEKLPLLIADAIAGPFHLESAGYPAGKLAVQRFEQAIPAILGAFWRGVAFALGRRLNHRPDLGCTLDNGQYARGLDDPWRPTLEDPDDDVSRYRGIEVVWDEHRDRRILAFLDEMGGRFRKRPGARRRGPAACSAGRRSAVQRD
jgi:hypothetical protein